MDSYAISYQIPKYRSLAGTLVEPAVNYYTILSDSCLLVLGNNMRSMISAVKILLSHWLWNIINALTQVHLTHNMFIHQAVCNDNGTYGNISDKEEKFCI